MDEIVGYVLLFCGFAFFAFFVVLLVCHFVLYALYAIFATVSIDQLFAIRDSLLLSFLLIRYL